MAEGTGLPKDSAGNLCHLEEIGCNGPNRNNITLPKGLLAPPNLEKLNSSAVPFIGAFDSLPPGKFPCRGNAISMPNDTFAQGAYIGGIYNLLGFLKFRWCSSGNRKQGDLQKSVNLSFGGGH
jgi:hypothetical protein